MATENPSPPTSVYDFNVGKVTKQKVYYLPDGNLCTYMNEILKLNPEAFISGSESSSDWSSDESSTSIKDVTIISSSISIKKSINKEKLSDSVKSSISKNASNFKAKSKVSKQTSPQSKMSLVEYPESDSDEGNQKSRIKKYSTQTKEVRSKVSRKKSSKPIEEEEVAHEESKYTPGLTSAFGSFHCQVCDIAVNSEATYQTHLQGKRHLKALKAKDISGVVIQSLNEPKLPPSLVGVSSTSFKKTRRIVIDEKSLIQTVADKYKEGPLPCLSDVVEIRPISGWKDTIYLCNRCEAQCVPNSIMKHLTGFKHYLRCLEVIDPKSYEKYRFSTKRSIEERVKRILLDHERWHEREIIRVEKEVDEQHLQRNEAGPSWRNEVSTAAIAPNSHGFYEDDIVSSMEYLDTAMNDFYCKACDAHMNNKAMWESHVRGKRHLKNVKKVPGESTSKIKSYPCPNETPHLIRLLEDLPEEDDYGNPNLIVGLEFIKETQNENGDIYNCYLCGACPSSYDIIDHLLQAKHKVKYLEAMNAKGKTNSIEAIKSLSDVTASSKEGMINEECFESLKTYGQGKVIVYKSKNILAPSSYSSHCSRH